MKKTKMLKKNYEFSKIFSKGSYYSGKSIESFILKNETNCNYLGLAISSKAGHAYQRNRIKRYLRENYKFFEKQIVSGVNIIFLLKKKTKIEDIGFYEVKEDMKKIFQKAKLFESNKDS